MNPDDSSLCVARTTRSSSVNVILSTVHERSRVFFAHRRAVSAPRKAAIASASTAVGAVKAKGPIESKRAAATNHATAAQASTLGRQRYS